MEKKVIRTLAAVLLLGGVMALVTDIVSVTPADAAITREEVGGPLEEAQALANGGQWAAALEKVREADAAPNKNAEESAAINQLMAYYASQARNYNAALTAYDRMIAAGQGNRTQNLRTAMRIALNARNSQRAIQYAQQLGNAMNAADRALVAQAHYLSGNFRQVVTLLRPMADGGGRPSETTLEALRAAYFQLNDEAGTQHALELLTLHYSSQTYWQQLIAIAQRQPGRTDKQSLELYRLREAVGTLETQEDYSEMAQIAMVAGLPGDAKKALNRAHEENLLEGERSQRLVVATNQAVGRDAATVAQLQQQAVAGNGDGNAEVRLGEIMWTYGRGEEGEAMVKRGIAEGNLDDLDAARVTLGQILVDNDKRQEAIQVLNAVSQDGRHASIARLWSIFART